MSLFGDNPDPYRALERVLSLRPQAQRKLLRLVVWCEWSKCTPLRVFAVRDGLLVQCRSDADVRDQQAMYPHLDDWSRRRAFFLQTWLSEAPEQPLQVVCDCKQTETRLVDLQQVASRVPESGTARNVSLPEVAATR